MATTQRSHPELAWTGPVRVPSVHMHLNTKLDRVIDNSEKVERTQMPIGGERVNNKQSIHTTVLSDLP